MSSRRVFEVYCVLDWYEGEHLYSACCLREETGAGTKDGGQWQHLLRETGGLARSQQGANSPSAGALKKKKKPPRSRPKSVCSQQRKRRSPVPRGKHRVRSFHSVVSSLQLLPSSSAVRPAIRNWKLDIHPPVSEWPMTVKNKEILAFLFINI